MNITTCQRRAAYTLALLMLTACSSEPSPLELHEASAPVQSASEPFQTLWERPQHKLMNKRDQADRPRLRFTRIALSPSSLAFDLVHQYRERQTQAPSVKPELRILLDSCPIDVPPYHGLVERGGREGRIVIPRAQLPLGELELTFTAFDSASTIVVLNDGTSITPISGEERKNRRVVPADPADPEGVQVVEADDSPSCPATKAQPAFRKVYEL